MMTNNRFVDVIYTHTDGEPTCIIHGGIPYPHGLSVTEKRQFIRDNYNFVRTALLREPRGHHDMVGVFVTPPSSPDYDAGMLWCDGDDFMEMCGHGTIALSMALVSHGLVHDAGGDVTKIRFETPAGDVTSEVGRENGQIAWTKFQNVPAFVLEQDVPITLPGYGELKADITFGGNFFAVVKWPDGVRPIGPQNGKLLSEMGVLVKDQINAKMTMFEARGQMKIGQTIKSEGLLGQGRFEGQLLGETMLGNQRAVIPTVKGTAKVIGYAKWLIDETDPVGRGFTIT